jgi:hypothetical protein
MNPANIFIDNAKDYFSDLITAGVLVGPVRLGERPTVKGFLKSHEVGCYLLTVKSLEKSFGQAVIHFCLLNDGVLTNAQLDHLGQEVLSAIQLHKPKLIQ